MTPTVELLGKERGAMRATRRPGPQGRCVSTLGPLVVLVAQGVTASFRARLLGFEAQPAALRDAPEACAETSMGCTRLCAKPTCCGRCHLPPPALPHPRVASRDNDLLQSQSVSHPPPPHSVSLHPFTLKRGSFKECLGGVYVCAWVGHTMPAWQQRGRAQGVWEYST